MTATYLAIEGPIGVGKTTLAGFLRDSLAAEVVLDVFENPFLADFYNDRPGAAFRAQMYFLITRFEQQLRIKDDQAEVPLMVTDYLFARDKIFAYLNLDDQEILVYDKYFESLSGWLPVPDLVVYLQAPTEVLLERVHRRKVDFESKISDSYLEELRKAYDHFFYHYTDSPLLIVNTAEIDFVENAAERKALIQRMAAGKVRGVEYYHPVQKR